MAKEVRGEFETQAGAGAAKEILKKSLCAVGSSRIEIKQREKILEICISDDSPSKEKAAQFGAQRLARMLGEIDREI